MSAVQNELPSISERRRHQRLDLRLPAECRQQRGESAYVVRTITQNVGTGGLYFELDSADFRTGDRLDLELTIPAAEGVFPYPGRVATRAEVLRVTPLEPKRGLALHRFGLAARFLEPLRFSY
jgi:hypothetical protein